MAAVVGQCVALGVIEGDLLRGGEQFEQGPLGDVAEQVVGFDEVVAEVQVTVVLQGERAAAGPGRPKP